MHRENTDTILVTWKSHNKGGYTDQQNMPREDPI